MTVADLKAAFVDNASIIEQKFGGVQYRITDALTVIRSEWGLWLTQMDSTLGVTNTIANAMVKFSDTAMRVMNRVRNAVQWLSDKLGGSEKLLKLLTITVGAFLIASKEGQGDWLLEERRLSPWQAQNRPRCPQPQGRRHRGRIIILAR